MISFVIDRLHALAGILRQSILVNWSSLSGLLNNLVGNVKQVNSAFF